VNCETVQNENVVERYVLGQLTAEELGSFEEHYFECEPCFEQVRLMQGLQAAGEGRPRPARVLEMPGRKWQVWAAAAVVLAGVGIAAMRQFGQPAAPVASAPAATAAKVDAERVLLARVEPPNYTAAALRGSAGDRAENFAAAMAKFSGGDYRAAADGLRGLVEGGPETAAARFYLGVSDLMLDNWQEPVTLMRSIDAMGETPYLEQARFFLAKALLAGNDAGGAAKALEATIALKGDRETEARELLERVRKLP
jgi:TolA-binding protein